MTSGLRVPDKVSLMSSQRKAIGIARGNQAEPWKIQDLEIMYPLEVIFFLCSRFIEGTTTGMLSIDPSQRQHGRHEIFGVSTGI